MTAAADLRVGWCPGALRPMASGDGLILRVKPRGAALSLAQARGLALLAARHGNGLLDLTARANLQIRGVAPDGTDAVTAGLDALGLVDADAGAEARRNVLAAPLAGLDPAALRDIRPAVAALEARLAAETALAGLPSKFGVSVCDGGRLPLGAASADIRFAAMADGRFAVSLDGAAEAVAACGAAAVPDVAVRLAAAFLARSAGRDLHRMRDLVAAEGPGPVRAAAGLEDAPDLPPAPPPAPAARPVPAGPIALGGGGMALGVAVPFGRLSARQLLGLAESAAEAGAAGLRVTPWRSLLAHGLDAAGAAALAAASAGAGLVVDPADPRLRVAACPGAPGCRRGTTPVLDHAARFARLLGPGPAGAGILLHVSGCRKGCAHPGPASLTLVAEAGRYALVADGAADGPPVASGLDAEEAHRLLKTTLRWDRRP